MSGDPEHLESRCSWCLAIAGHERKEKNKIRRSVYRCTACGKDTLPCKQCLPSGAEGARVSASRASSFSRLTSGGGGGSVGRTGSAAAMPLESGMARHDKLWSNDHCSVCEGTLGVWPSPMDAELALQLGRTRSATQMAHTESVATPVTAPRNDIAPDEIETLQRALLKAQRSMLVRIDNKTPHALQLIGRMTLIEEEGLSGGSWRRVVAEPSSGGKQLGHVPPPSTIESNQAVAFGTESLGLNRGGTSARVAYEICDEAGNRLAAVQMRWVNPLVNGEMGNWCETRTDFANGDGPKITRVQPTKNDHSCVSFIIHFGPGEPDHFNPDGPSPALAAAAAAADLTSSV